ncbi:MAG: Serine/threonine-protein kinase PknD [Gemmatimonadaceae bacterium]|nr:Serine/threonine-protein kinase PknD [Gemmatimonadaceae bacterium]
MPDALRDRVEAALGDAYEFETEIGRGGMGVVYRARDRKLRRLVAIKVLPPDLAFRDEIRTRFLREAETAAQLNHPNIVPIYAVEERAGLVGFVMALVDGESLGARLAREPHPPIEDVRCILRDVADALAYAHKRGIVHRDIKPDNILLDRATGRPMVTDFGIARAMEGDSRLTVTGIAVGTPAYMSPEQATGDREIDGRSDLYALAIVGYQMLAGELPFRAANTPSMLMKHISERPRPLHELRPDVPRRLQRAIERALAKKPQDRWEDATAFRDALSAPDDAVPAGPSASGGDVPHDRLSAAWKRPALPARVTPSRRHDPLADFEAEFGHVDRDRPIARPPEAPRGRDAIDAAAALPPIPSWMPSSWREARKQWGPGISRRQYREMLRAQRHAFAAAPGEGPSDEERIRTFRRRTASTAVTIGVLFFVNAGITHGDPWFLIPSAFLAFGWLRRASTLWADGISIRRVFGRQARQALEKGSQKVPALPPTLDELALALAPAEVLQGPYGTAVRGAAADREAASDALSKLSAADKALIPDVAPTLDALAERVGSLAQSLHRMDEDITPQTLADLERRLETARRQPESAERDQRVALLERQRATTDDLMRRRDTLRTQLDSAGLMLQSLRLDLLALRSAGVQSAMDDVSSATQEARALSRDIANALAAAKEIR